ncbi:MAG TPA: hypothetical protein VF868_04595 [Bacteroidia bacterium]
MKDLIFTCAFLIAVSFAACGQQGVKEPQFDINDPRNPRCPCHKLQKLAEEQYQQRHRTVKRPSYPGKHGFRVQRSKLEKKVTALRLRFLRKNLNGKVKPDFSVCYKW